MNKPNIEGRRLGFAVLVFVLATILVVTLEPLRFRMPHRIRIALWSGWFDVIANVALFMIPGFLHALAGLANRSDESPAEWRRGTLVRAFAFAALFSFTIEVVQLFEPARYPSPVDVVSNASGALLGAAVLLRIARLLRADTPIIRNLALELPLMGLVYLVVPLSMLAALAMPREASVSHAAGLVSLGMFMGILLGHVQRHGIGPLGLARPSRTALASAVAFMIGTMPAAPFHPMVVVAGAIGTATCVLVIGSWRLDSAALVERRYEASALRRAAPFLLAYLFLSAVVTSAPGRLSRMSIIDDVESYAAFTVSGYLLAEWWGRREMRLRLVVMSVGGVCLAVALAGAHSFGGSALTAAFVRALAGAYGGLIYHLQRAHVRSLATAQRSNQTAHSLVGA